MNDDLIARLKNSQLPSLPAITIRVLELSRQSNSGMDEIGEIISSDPTLLAKVLNAVNSTFYGNPNQVSTIDQALAIMGVQSTKTMALAFWFSASLNFDKSPTFNYTRFWRQSLYTAVAARALAKATRSPHYEDAFPAGLLSNAGTLVMHRVLGSEYDVLLETSAGDQVKLIKLSREKFDLDHAQAGGMLAEHWGLPPILIEGVRQHHDFADDGSEFSQLAKIVHGGVLCGQVFATDTPGMLEQAHAVLAEQFNLTISQIDEIFRLIDTNAAELAKLFEMDIGLGRTYRDIQDEAKQALIEMTLQTQFESRKMQHQNEQLQVRANTDALTGLANRARFDQVLQQAFADARGNSQPLAVLMLDLDKFKTVNDTYGHQAGDEVLVHVGMLLASQFTGGSLAARYGGEEFAVILRATDAAAAMTAAENLCRAVRSEIIIFNGTNISVTASIGVAVANDQTSFAGPAQLVAAADQAVYSAKQSGRNCVRLMGHGGTTTRPQ